MGRRPLSICLLCFLAVFLAVSMLRKPAEESGQNLLDGQRITLTGIVSEVYEPLDPFSKDYILYLKQVKILTSSVNTFSKNPESIQRKQTGAVCYLDSSSKIPHIGAAVRLSGTVFPFSKATNPGEFDAASYYELRGYQYQLTDVCIEAESTDYDHTEQFFQELRRKIAGVFVLLLGEKNAALASAMILGRKKDIDDSIEMLYQSAGISHILAISGLHISMVGNSLFSAFKKAGLPLWIASCTGMLLICIYGIFTGMSISTLRAVLMFLLVMLAGLVHRTPDTLTSLIAAAAMILVQNPKNWMDSGFQLSFSAVAGISLVVPVLKEREIRQQKLHGIRQKCLDRIYEGVSVSLGVTLTMFPFLLMHFYTWNPWSLLYNPIAVFLTGLLLPQLFLLAGLGLLFGQIPVLLPVLRIAALPAGVIFTVLEKGSSLLQKLPGSCLHIGMPKIWQILIFLAGLAGLTAFGKKLRPCFRMMAAVGLLSVFLVRLPGTLTVTMLDVGQGAAFVVQTPEHQAYLLDAGSSSESHVGKYRVVPYLKYCGIRSLEAIFVSHWDEDHISALEELFDWAAWEHVPIRTLILPDTSLQDEALDKLLTLAFEYEIPVLRMGTGDRWEKDSISFACLHPFQGEAAAERNAVSLALRLEWENFAALFPGDLEAAQENRLCQVYGREKLSCQLLAAGHHGSATSSTEVFLEMTDPKAVLISCGEKNRYGHPHKEVLSRLENRHTARYISAETGAVTVTVDHARMHISEFLQKEKF